MEERDLIARLRDPSDNGPFEFLTVSGKRERFARLAVYGREEGFECLYCLMQPFGNALLSPRVYCVAIGADGDVYVALDDDPDTIARVNVLYRRGKR